ncbi:MULTISPECIES: helix-turn-helix transcriptional regulator [unclassified Pseudomonas]|uniref:ArsR/SmtB family transcription factor n=1 Tax=unclassified Pseudomonas TaxID=196821 RepID=UPI002448DD71|nr:MULTISPECIES: helix-turn-helix transcriptional regulator [unclassified Pseudomonas]MDH0305286.1 ArsR family transcriptional regulator [Pseudomonas sp. GD04091]MDH1986883.1 ArsR family transcriptional regulator [Pseudomonas sp. GD03689]
MSAVRSISQVASLMADPKRSAMLWALIDGTPRAADELARMIGLSTSSACAHLSLLSTAGLLKLETRGRKRYFRLATPQVSAAVEALASVQVESRPVAKRAMPIQIPPSMRRARLCGDHLGGEMAAALFQRLLDVGWLVGNEQQLFVSQEGKVRLEALGVYIDALAPGTRRGCVTCRCSEWSDQGAHLGGTLGQAMLRLFLQSGWVREQEGNRALQLTSLGVQQINGIARMSARQAG